MIVTSRRKLSAQYHILVQKLVFVLEGDGMERSKYSIALGCGGLPSAKPENITVINPTNSMRHATTNCHAQMAWRITAV